MKLELIAPNTQKYPHKQRKTILPPLGLATVAALTPPDIEVSLTDENITAIDFQKELDLVGITAFTSQAMGAYKVADAFRRLGVPVVMGGIHATMCEQEALARVDAIVTGEAESIWGTVLEDAQTASLKRVYRGAHVSLDTVPVARHDLLPRGYRFGSIQVTRGCPLNCTFCSVTADRLWELSICGLLTPLLTLPDGHTVFRHTRQASQFHPRILGSVVITASRRKQVEL